MYGNLILWPVFLQITLTLLVFLMLGKRKAQAFKAGDADLKKAALDNSAWPENVVKASNNIQNQFQTPVLFYTLCFAFLALNAVSATVLGLAWAFALSRLVHAYVHINSNYVPLRFNMFLIGTIILIVMTVFLAIGLTQLTG